LRSKLARAAFLFLPLALILFSLLPLYPEKRALREPIPVLAAVSGFIEAEKGFEFGPSEPCQDLGLLIVHVS
jgi:hypothetical protein